MGLIEPVRPFVAFDFYHSSALLVIGVLAIGLSAFTWWLQNPRFTRAAAVTLGVLLIAHELLKPFMRTGIYGFPLENELPLHLCRIGAIITGIMLIQRSYRLYEITYFWGLGAGLLALFMPDLDVHGYPTLAWMSFMIGHGLIIIGVVFATVNYGFRPTFWSVNKAAAAVILLGCIILPLNLLLGSNYLFLADKPDVPIFNMMPAEPWHIPPLIVLGYIIFTIAWLPYAGLEAVLRVFGVRISMRKQRAAATESA